MIHNRWIPLTKGELYYSFSILSYGRFEINRTIFMGDSFDLKNIESGNCFESEDLAEKNAKQILLRIKFPTLVPGALVRILPGVGDWAAKQGYTGFYKELETRIFMVSDITSEEVVLSLPEWKNCPTHDDDGPNELGIPFEFIEVMERDRFFHRFRNLMREYNTNVLEVKP